VNADSASSSTAASTFPFVSTSIGATFVVVRVPVVPVDDTLGFSSPLFTDDDDVRVVTDFFFFDSLSSRVLA